MQVHGDTSDGERAGPEQVHQSLLSRIRTFGTAPQRSGGHVQFDSEQQNVLIIHTSTLYVTVLQPPPPSLMLMCLNLVRQLTDVAWEEVITLSLDTTLCVVTRSYLTNRPPFLSEVSDSRQQRLL